MPAGQARSSVKPLWQTARKRRILEPLVDLPPRHRLETGPAGDKCYLASALYLMLSAALNGIFALEIRQL